MSKPIYIGIDYSYTGPAMTIHKGDSWSFSNCKVYSLTSTKKYHTTYLNNQISLKDFKPWITNEQRFDQISDFFIDEIKKLKGNIICGVENYSFASKGMQFTIGENTGILKHKLYKLGIETHVFAPKTVKKFAISGNADKDDMNNAFFADTRVDLIKVFDYNRKKFDSPLADIVDSYFVCKYLFNEKENNANPDIKT